MSICVVNKTGIEQTLSGNTKIANGQTMCYYKKGNDRIWSTTQPQDSSKVTPNDLIQTENLISQIAPGYEAPLSAYTFPTEEDVAKFTSNVAAASNDQLTVVIQTTLAESKGTQEDPFENVNEIVKEGPSYKG
jgi:hypothetical protein